MSTTNEVPKILQCWQSQDEKEKPLERQRWMGRFTFILAAIGSAIGLGNFWRFPYLTYKHGGAEFFFPWATCLFVMGIPFMIMELALGQKFQRGDIAVFRGIDRRLAGIGVVSVYSSYIFSWYYNVVVAWALVYVISSFASPLPWSEKIEDKDWKCFKEGDDKALIKSRAEEFFRINVIRLVAPGGCAEYKTGDETMFSTNALLATFACWIIIFFCVFKGVKSSSFIVWLTVPLPVLFVFIMIINGASLDGSEQGIKKYFGGQIADQQTTTAERWSDAAGQIFLGLSVCLGIMTSYGSYNEPKKPIIMDSIIISVCNCSFSFIAGFAVWSVVGYLEKLGKLDPKNLSGVGLAFITYPTAIDTMSAPNFWALLLGLTLFMLGIDSSFSAIEATSTVICDTAWSGKAPRMFVAFVLCVVGFLGSLPFCCNWGFILFDVVDHYLCAYLLIMIGILQAFGCGWFFDIKDTMAKSEGHKNSLLFISYTFWGILILIACVTTFMEKQLIGMISFWVIYIICMIIGLKLSNLSPKQYYEEILMCGVRKIAYSCSQMGRENPQEMLWWEPAFVIYWGVLVKYINPMLLMFIQVGILRDDLKKNYGGYDTQWQVIGWAIPIIGLLLFFMSICICQSEQELNYSEFELYIQDGTQPNGSNKVDGEKENVVEMSAPVE